MSLVIAFSGLSELAVEWCDAGGLHGSLHPLLGVCAVRREIGRLGLVLLAQERQMRLQVVIAGSQPFAPVGECGGRFLAGIEEIGDKTLLLNLLIAAADPDSVVVRPREFRISERPISIAQKRLPRAGRPIG